MPPATFKLGPLEVPLPGKWAGAFAGLAFVGLLGWGGLTAYDHLDSDSKRISPGDLQQLEQAQRHFTEPPESTMTVFNDVRGSLIIRSYLSDGCLLIERRAQGAPTSTRFVPDLSRSTVAVKRSDAPVYFGSSPAWAQGRCIDVATHPGKFVSENNVLGECLIQVTRRYDDGCVGSQNFDRCISSWGPWVWRECRH